MPRIYKSYLLIAKSLNFAPFEKVIEGTDVDTDGEFLEVSQAIQLVRNLEQCSRTPNWAAIFGAHLGVASHGPVGYAAAAAPTLGEALSTFAEWFRIRCETYRCRISATDDEFVIEIQDTTGDELFERFFFEAFMRAFEVIVGLILGELPSGQTTLEFRTQAENRRELMIEEYESRLFFGRPKNLLRVPKLIWQQPSPLSDPAAFELNLRACKQLKDSRGDIPQMVRQVVEGHFDRGAEGPPPSLNDICARLHIAERTLIRRLKAHGTPYKRIVDEARFNFAKRMLNQPYRMVEIAEKLGYKEPASFCRAFKRWSGQSPTDYRLNISGRR